MYKMICLPKLTYNVFTMTFDYQELANSSCYFNTNENKHTRGIFYVRRIVDLMITAKVNTYIVYIYI